jgi:glutamyl-tRNA synthetase
LGLYEEALNLLIARELVYPCTCTRADIERAALAPHAEDEGPTYPGTCAHRNVNDARALGDRTFAWRFRVPAERVSWNDLYLGRVELDPSQVGGDFVVARQTVGYSYQLAVVTDDSAMGISQVIRGMDLVPSTPRQILLYQALGLPVPAFGHVALAVGPDGRRLAKRDGSLKLATLREAGVDPCRLVGMLIHSCGWSDRAVAITPRAAIDRYAPTRLAALPWVVSEPWLESLQRR